MDKEKIYDEQVSPLIERAGKICIDNNMPFFYETKFSDTGYCTSYNISDDLFMLVCSALSQSKTEQTINIDNFLMWFIKKFDVNQSIFLREFSKHSHNNDCTATAEPSPKSPDGDFVQS